MSLTIFVLVNMPMVCRSLIDEVGKGKRNVVARFQVQRGN